MIIEFVVVEEVQAPNGGPQSPIVGRSDHAQLDDYYCDLENPRSHRLGDDDQMGRRSPG